MRADYHATTQRSVDGDHCLARLCAADAALFMGRPGRVPAGAAAGAARGDGRPVLAGRCFMIMLPMYFVIGQATADRLTISPSSRSIARCRSLRAWMRRLRLALHGGFLLPLVVVRGRQRFEQVAEGVPVRDAGVLCRVLVYPTVAPRDRTGGHRRIRGPGRCSCSMTIDQPYGCFPSLHVAFALVGALACYRMHRGVGRGRPRPGRC